MRIYIIYKMTFSRLILLIRNSIAYDVAFLVAGMGVAQSVPDATISTTTPSIVIGFVGGWIKADNMVHSEVQLAARLRKAYPAGVAVETFESYRGKEAHKKVLRLLDTNH